MSLPNKSEKSKLKNSKIRRISILLIVIAYLFLLSCQNVIYIGNSQKGFKKIDRYKITPQQALELAKPHLALSYKMRSKNRNFKSDRLPVDHIVMTGPWYHIARDNYPYKAIQAYLKHAVQVHAQTGQVVSPE